MRLLSLTVIVVSGFVAGLGCGGSGASSGVGRAFVVSPDRATVARGGSLVLHGEPAEYGGDYVVGWSVREGAPGGTVVPSTDAGLPTATYAAPSASGTYHVVASLTSELGDRTATATIVVP